MSLIQRSCKTSPCLPESRASGGNSCSSGSTNNQQNDLVDVIEVSLPNLTRGINTIYIILFPRYGSYYEPAQPTVL
eukprot:jgi/Chrzof1/9440/Cz04g03060.t1